MRVRTTKGLGKIYLVSHWVLIFPSHKHDKRISGPSVSVCEDTHTRKRMTRASCHLQKHNHLLECLGLMVNLIMVVPFSRMLMHPIMLTSVAFHYQSQDPSITCSSCLLVTISAQGSFSSSNNPDDRCFQVGFGSQLRCGVVDQVVQVVQVGNILNGYDSRQVELDRDLIYVQCERSYYRMVHLHIDTVRCWLQSITSKFGKEGIMDMVADAPWPVGVMGV